MTKLLAVISLLVLSGCAQIQAWVPSFWDDNQSARIIDVRSRVESINCVDTQKPQVEAVARELRWFEMYSQSKGQLQKDVLRVIEPMQATVKEWTERGEGSKTYCELKKKLLIQQGERASKVILGRW